MSLESWRGSQGPDGQGSKVFDADGMGDPLRTIPLLNAMVDVALVYGFDETCCRELGVMIDEEVREEVGGGGREREGKGCGGKRSKGTKEEKLEWGERR